MTNTVTYNQFKTALSETITKAKEFNKTTETDKDPEPGETDVSEVKPDKNKDSDK